MSTKIRNKSAHNTGINIATGENLVNNNGNHHQSLLKIESVVPKLTSRTLKLQKPHLTKSHSTLTSAYIKKVNESKRTFVVSGNGSTKQLAVETGGGHCAGNDASIFINNGIYTIKRNQKEKDKLPDRINLDRKGLTMIPAIEEEPNLRLLSLQHNLINVFYISSGDIPTTTLKQPDQVSSPPKELNVPLNNITTTTNQFVTNPPRNAILHRQLSRQRSITTRNQLILNNNNISYMGNKANNGISNNGSSSSNNSAMNNNNGNPTFLQKSLLLNAQPKHILKKSNSFINNSSNYPSFLTTAPTTSFMTQQQQQKSQMRNKLTHTPSFSVDNLSSMSGSTANGNHLNGDDPSTLPGTSASNTPDLIKTGNVIDSPPPAIDVKHNLINLVFLDLYDNQIEVIGNLEGLKSLTVLLLGKNRITDISGLVCVKNTLRVLDLHGNKISNISAKISPLQELKSLNLAGNMLKQVHDKDFAGLYCLKELNLKRNKIKKICGFEDLRSLERLWLCHNELQRVEDMSSIARALNLKEVTIENNPVSLAGDCVSFLVSYLPNLISLSQMQITEQVRRAAAAWRKNKEASDANYLHLTSDVCHSMRREEIISNARTNWELLRSQQSISTTLKHPHPPQKVIPSPKMPVRENDHLLDHENRGSKRYTRPSLAPNNRFKKISRKPLKPISRDNSTTSEQGGEDYFRLPPILSPFLDHNKDSPNSNSSLGPNVDSGSSVYSSDNDGEKDGDKLNKLKQDTPEQTIIVKVTEESVSETVESKSSNIPQALPNGLDQASTSSTSSTKPEHSVTPKQDDPKLETLLPIPIAIHEITLPIPGPEELNPVDKQSNVSTNSAKSNESLVTNMSAHKNNEQSNGANGHTEQKSERCKSSMPKRQNTISSISSSRAQTARNTNNANGNNTNGNSSSNANNSNNAQNKTQNKAERDREQGGDYLIEICGRYLNVYGYGALKFIDKQWNVQKATDVHTIKFSYINYNNITAALGKVKIRFPNAEHFVFRETNMYCLGQLNALAETQGLVSLTIDCEGNTIMSKNWRSYAIYRLSHWGLKVINDDEITEEEIQTSEALYSGLSDLVLWSLPEALLQPLLTRLRLEETCQASKMTAKEWLMQAEASLKSVVGKEALQWKKNGQFHEEQTTREKGKKHFTFMMENTCNAVEKLQRLDTMWPSVLHQMIRNTLIDYSQIDAYVKNLMQELLK